MHSQWGVVRWLDAHRKHARGVAALSVIEATRAQIRTPRRNLRDRVPAHLASRFIALYKTEQKIEAALGR